MTSPLASVAGQVALVAGGTAGIGFACAERFAAEGASVTLLGRDAERGAAACERIGDKGNARFVAADCASETEVESAVSAVLEAHGRIDILVTCVGGFYASPRLDAIAPAAWRAGLDWNLTPKFLLARAVFPAMKAQGYGRIVNVASVAGRTGIAIAPADYSAAKAGVAGLTRRLAAELAPFGITCNAVAPGTVLTPRLARLSERRLEQVRAKIPIGRLGKPEEIAHGIHYLCTPGAAFVTGAVLDMNGGVWTG